MEETKQNTGSKRGLVILLLLLLAVSAALNVYLFNKKNEVETIIEKDNNRMVNTESLKKELQKELDRVRMELDEFRKKGSKYDSIINAKEQLLIAKAGQIDKLLKDNKINYRKFLTAKDEVDEWKYNAEKYLTQIEELTKENKKLKDENKNLNDEVENRKKENNKLKDENITYGNKIYMGAMLKAENLTIIPVRFKSNGKERETNKASQVEKIKICFDVPENHVADAGTKIVYIKVIGPNGATISIEALGSGTFKFEGAESKYTSRDEILFDNMPKNYCMYWGFAKDAKLHDGIYKIELYGEGYKMGEKNFTLK